MVLAIISDSQNVFLQFSKMGIINSFCAEFISFCAEFISFYANMKYLNKKALCLISIAAEKLFH